MEIPVKMNHEYFHKRVETGYFKIKKRSLKQFGQIVESKAGWSLFYPTGIRDMICNSIVFHM